MEKRAGGASGVDELLSLILNGAGGKKLIRANEPRKIVTLLL